MGDKSWDIDICRTSTVTGSCFAFKTNLLDARLIFSMAFPLVAEITQRTYQLAPPSGNEFKRNSIERFQMPKVAFAKRNVGCNSGCTCKQSTHMLFGAFRKSGVAIQGAPGLFDDANTFGHNHEGSG